MQHLNYDAFHAHWSLPSKEIKIIKFLWLRSLLFRRQKSSSFNDCLIFHFFPNKQVQASKHSLTTSQKFMFLTNDHSDLFIAAWIARFLCISSGLFFKSRACFQYFIKLPYFYFYQSIREFFVKSLKRCYAKILMLAYNNPSRWIWLI